MTSQPSKETSQSDFDAWYADGDRIQRQRNREAIVDPVIDVATGLARWVRRTK